MTNPFQYGTEVSGYQFYDRKEPMEELHSLLSDGSSNVVLYAPRRYGKTSMVLRVFERLRLDGFKCVYFNMAKIASLERFAEEYTSLIYTLASPIQGIGHKIGEYLAHLHPTFTFGGDGLCSVRFDYGMRMSAQTLSSVLDLPEKIGTEMKVPLVVGFDEFQEIGELSKEIPLEGVFRSCIQAHRNVRYVFFGSKTHLMRRMFGSHSRPFYKSALNMKLGKPPIDESFEFVASRFAGEGLSIAGELVEKILELSENIPYFLQAISALTFQSVIRRRATEVEISDVLQAVKRFQEANEGLYEEQLRNLSGAQRLLTEALAKEPTAQFDESYRLRHGLGVSSTVHSSLGKLELKGIVESDREGYRIGDPFFAKYIRESKVGLVLG